MKNIMKAITLVLCLCVVFSLVACGNKPATQDSTPSTQGTQSYEQTENDEIEGNQCAADATLDTEQTDYPTEPFVPETTEEEAYVNETLDTVPAESEEEPASEADEELGDIQLPLDEITE